MSEPSTSAHHKPISVLSLGFRTIALCVISLTAFFLVDPVEPSGEPDLQLTTDGSSHQSPLPMRDQTAPTTTEAVLVAVAAAGASFGFGLAYHQGERDRRPFST